MNPHDTKLTVHPGAIPTTPIVWPSNSHIKNQIQQTKGQAKPQADVLTPPVPTTQPSQRQVPPVTTPKNVSHVRVVTSPPVNGQKTIFVQFNHPPNDPFFAGANIYLKKSGDQQPRLVGGGAKSPIKITVPVNTAPHTIHVTSFGNWGETEVANAPSHPVRLM